MSRVDAIHHLLRIGLVTSQELLDGSVTASEFFGRNHLVRIDLSSGCSFTIKQPRDVDAYDSMTMWTEAAIFWLSANDPEFERLAPWMPRYFHYHEPDKVLTIEFVTGGDSLMAKLIAGTAPAGLLGDVGRALATLHGPVSRATAAQPSRRLFADHIPWVLTLGTPQMRYAAPNPVAWSVLGEALRRPDAIAGLAGARSEWRTDQIVHGDVKGANVLILDDGSIRLIDWEIAALGDGLWDLAGLVHSLLLPNPMEPNEPLAALQARAAPWLEALCSGYWSAPAAPARPPRWRERVLRLTGARLLQTCLESVHHADRVPPAVPSLVNLAAGLIARPEAATGGWRWAA